MGARYDRYSYALPSNPSTLTVGQANTCLLACAPEREFLCEGGTDTLKLDCHLCFDKALRTSLIGEIIAWWNKNSEERGREMPKMTRITILLQLSLPFESVTVCTYICILIVLWKRLHWNKSRRSTHKTCIHTRIQVLGGCLIFSNGKSLL